VQIEEVGPPFTLCSCFLKKKTSRKGGLFRLKLSNVSNGYGERFGERHGKKPDSHLPILTILFSSLSYSLKAVDSGLVSPQAVDSLFSQQLQYFSLFAYKQQV
jgi:hypothetical protein